MGFRGHDAKLLRERNGDERINSFKLTQLDSNDGTWFELPILVCWIVARRRHQPRLVGLQEFGRCWPKHDGPLSE